MAELSEPERAAAILGEKLQFALVSPSECDRNLEAANVVDGLYMIARAIERLAEAVEKHNG